MAFVLLLSDRAGTKLLVTVFALLFIVEVLFIVVAATDLPLFVA